MRKAGEDATKEHNDNGEQDYDREVEREGTDPYDEVIFGRDYKERGESRTRAQRDILIKSLERVAKDAEGENGVWKIRLIIFVGGTCGSVNVKS
jgi:hypothetical protein